MSTNEDIMGAEDDIMGALANMVQQSRQRRGFGGGFGGRGGGGGMQRASAFGARNQLPGRPTLPDMNVQVDNIRSWAGLGVAEWTGTDAGVKTLTIEPQDAWASKRLVFVEARSDGAAASIVSLAQFFVGSTPQSPVVDVLAPIAMFAPETTDAVVALSICYRGQSISCQLTVTAAPGSGESVTVVGGMFGDWIK